MWKTKSSLKDELIESLKRENAALRALLSASGIALPDSPVIPSAQPKRPFKKRTAADVYHATRETRLATQLQREMEQEPEVPPSPDPSASSNA